MKRLQLFLAVVFIALLTPAAMNAQGVTTSSMIGTIVDQSNEPLIGANLIAVHTPTGTSYGTSTNEDGSFGIPNMRVGGPYTITVSYIGYEDLIIENVMLNLGEKYKRTITMAESGVMLDELVVTALSGSTGQNVGASTQINAADIDVLPTLNRDIDDFLRLTPQANSTNGGTSFAGMNNRFNAIYIDGAVNNDVFGLAGSGTNGGQTGTAPFSVDIIDQLQIVLSPYDVSLGGFAGGGVNAVTKSGTNRFAGTAYYFLQNESLAGKTNGSFAESIGLADEDRTKLDDFAQSTYGVSLGGPIVKDKVFFFANVEVQDDETPAPFTQSQYTGVDPGRATASDLNRLKDHLLNTYNYDPGTFGNTSDELTGLKFFGKLDFNVNDKNKLTLRHQYTKAEQFNRNASNSGRINFSNNGVFFPSVTNSSALELNTTFSSKTSNNLIIGYTNVNDDRGSLGENFPYVVIDDAANGSIRFGTEEFSTGNFLSQKILTITDNFKIYNGKHTWTIGTHNEFYDIKNVFIRQNYGSYDYDNIDDFINGVGATDYDRSYSLVDNLTGDATSAAAEFKAMQLGLYVQDEITVNDKFTLTAGLRLDVPIISSDPAIASTFNTTTLNAIKPFYDLANEVEGGKAPQGQLMFSPRVGFSYDMKGDRTSILRGGAGVFTSRVPFVWPGGMFNNNGLTVGSVDERDLGGSGNVPFVADINQQYTNPNFTTPSGQIDIFTDDFKYPQVFRMNLAFDKEFSDGWRTSVEGIFTKTLNNVNYTNINSNPTVDFNWTGGPDDRPVYNRNSIDPTYSAIYVGSNTSEGSGYNLTASAEKAWDNGLSFFFAYTYSDSKSLNDTQSSQNSSQWRGSINYDGRNNPVFGRSDFSTGSRILSTINYNLKWGGSDKTNTQFSLFFNGQAGTAFSYIYGNRSAQNLNNETGSTSRNRSLIYVPASASDINLIDYTSGGSTVSAAVQYQRLKTFIDSDKSLSESRGGYAEKNGSRAPYTGIFDFAIRQNFGKNFGGNDHRFQLSFDIFNFANFINKDWGVRYNVPGGNFNNYSLINFEGYAADGTTPQFTYRGPEVFNEDAFDISNGGSIWRARLGFRYIFN